MLKKINKFIDKYLNWKVLKNLLLAQLFLIPNSFIATLYGISSISLFIMNISFGLAVSFLTKVIKEFIEKKESL